MEESVAVALADALIGAAAAIAGGLVSGYLTVKWQGKQSVILARDLRREERQDQAFVKVMRLGNEVRDAVIAMVFEAKRTGKPQQSWRRAEDAVMRLAWEWQTELGGQIYDAKILELYNEVGWLLFLVRAHYVVGAFDELWKTSDDIIAATADLTSAVGERLRRPGVASESAS